MHSAYREKSLKARYFQLLKTVFSLNLTLMIPVALVENSWYCFTFTLRSIHLNVWKRLKIIANNDYKWILPAIKQYTEKSNLSYLKLLLNIPSLRVNPQVSDASVIDIWSPCSDSLELCIMRNKHNYKHCKPQLLCMSISHWYCELPEGYFCHWVGNTFWPFL